jgi:hypothetical protein
MAGPRYFGDGVNDYLWGETFKKDGRPMADTHQGHFFDRDTGEDGLIGIGPVAQFLANGYGLHDVPATSGSGSAIGTAPITTLNSRPAVALRAIRRNRRRPSIRRCCASPNG